MCVCSGTFTVTCNHTDGSRCLCRNYLSVGDCFGEVAFFTEIPQMQTVRTMTVCRVLVVPRSAYHSIKSGFPLGTRQVLENLQEHAEEVRTSSCINCGYAYILA